VNTTICRSDRQFKDPANYFGQNGILGLGRSVEREQGKTTALIEDIKTDALLERNLMTVKLSRKESKITFGSVDVDETKSPITWSDVGNLFSADGRCETNIDINGIGGSAILDIGATHTWFPRAKAIELFKTYNLTVVDQGGVVVGQYPCKTGAPQLQVNIAGFHFQMSQKTSRLTKNTANKCYLFINGADLDTKREIIVIGADVMMSEYTT
jgi:hypothetical protein